MIDNFVDSDNDVKTTKSGYLLLGALNTSHRLNANAGKSADFLYLSVKYKVLPVIILQKYRNTTAKRSPLWIFSEAKTIRQKIIHLAGRLTRPGGKLALTVNKNVSIEENFRKYLAALAA